MKWQVKYALANLNKESKQDCARYVENDFIEITIAGKPDVLAAIYGGYDVTKEIAEKYVQQNPDIDFLCGYRKDCVWEGAVNWHRYGSIPLAA